MKVAADFEEKWNFPHCVGALDGKHVIIKKPDNAASEYFNYKKTHSIVLMGLVDANYKFLYINCGAKGSNSDGGVWSRTKFCQKMYDGSLNIPSPSSLPGRSMDVPYVVISDDAFPLKENIMKPYGQKNLTPQQRIFNYRLSRARRVVENAFGILAARFKFLLRMIELQPDAVTDLVCAACVLHNFLITRSTESHPTSLDVGNVGELCGMQNIPQLSPNAAKGIREEFCQYFCNEGQVPWQYNFI